MFGNHEVRYCANKRLFNKEYLLLRNFEKYNRVKANRVQKVKACYVKVKFNSRLLALAIKASWKLPHSLKHFIG